MAMDTALIYPQDAFGYVYNKEFYALSGGCISYGFGFQEQEQDDQQKGFMDILLDTNNLNGNWDPNSSPEPCTGDQLIPMIDDDDNDDDDDEQQQQQLPTHPPPATGAAAKRKRRRTRTCKNKEELENQRMTHIAVERNRRKQMNDYLSVIRSLMPSSYVQRGDQASIIGGAINYVKELEQHLQTLEAAAAADKKSSNTDQQPPELESVEEEEDDKDQLFGDFFSFPQYSTSSSSSSSSSLMVVAAADQNHNRRSAVADIEVTMAESHANVKILTKKRQRQLLKLVAGLQCLFLTILHLNVTTAHDQIILYSISLKLEDGCKLTTVDEIADAVNHLLGRIQEEAAAAS